MIKCNVKPYFGNEKYIYVSYSYKDVSKVFPVIERLVRDGYRVFYNNAFECVSPEHEIKTKISHSEIMIFFATDNSLESADCFKEIDFAIKSDKKVISIFAEPVFLSPGREMFLSDLQAIYKYKYENNDEFYSNLYTIDLLKNCLGVPNEKIEISEPGDYIINLKNLYGVDFRLKNSFYNKWDYSDFSSGFAFIQQYKNNKKYAVTNVVTKLGRDKNSTEITLKNNSTISKLHAKILREDADYYLQDCNSKNKTFLNFIELKPMLKYSLQDGDLIRFSNERFVFHRTED